MRKIHPLEYAIGFVLLGGWAAGMVALALWLATHRWAQ